MIQASTVSADLVVLAPASQEGAVDGAVDCEDCSEEEYDAYCCGRVCEDGEATCASCGEPL